MIKDHEDDEFVAVRVQDPRVQNEGSWNSYVDFKIFLHTNSKAFTAKTSCVRRRYSEFVWLKKKMQKNAGLVPVPELPTKSFFSFSNEDFLEKRRKGLQSFLDKVLHLTVCLSDSQLHLFLQTQLPVGHILDCVHGHTPYTVTEAILTYASSNRGWTQEEGVAQDPSSQTVVSYESMESPAPHLPTLEGEPLSLVTLSPPHPPDRLLADLHDIDSVELQFNGTETPFLNGPREDREEAAVLERLGPVETPVLGQDSPGRAGDLEDVTQRKEDSLCRQQQQTPVEVHCEEEEEEEEYVVLVEEESHVDTATETETTPLPQSAPEPVLFTLGTPESILLPQTTPESPLLPQTIHESLHLTLSTPDSLLLPQTTPESLFLPQSTPESLHLTLSTPEPDSCRRETTPIDAGRSGAAVPGEAEAPATDFFCEEEEGATPQEEDSSRREAVVTEEVSHVTEDQEGDGHMEETSREAPDQDSLGEALLWGVSQAANEAQDDHSDVETIQDEEEEEEEVLIGFVEEAREGDHSRRWRDEGEEILWDEEAALEDVSQADEALEDDSREEEDGGGKGAAPLERQDSLDHMNERDFYQEICYEEEEDLEEDATAQEEEQHSDDSRTNQEVTSNDVTRTQDVTCNDVTRTQEVTCNDVTRTQEVTCNDVTRTQDVTCNDVTRTQDVTCNDVTRTQEVTCNDVTRTQDVTCNDVTRTQDVTCNDVTRTQDVTCNDVTRTQEVACIDVVTNQEVECNDVVTNQEVTCKDVVTNQEAERDGGGDRHATLREVETIVVIDDATRGKETPASDQSAQPIGGQQPVDPAQEEAWRGEDEDVSPVVEEERPAEETSSLDGGGSHDDSNDDDTDIEVANHVETTQETNGYMETTTITSSTSSEEIYSTARTEEVDLFTDALDTSLDIRG